MDKKRIITIASIATIVIGAYWTTGRMDPALAQFGLNYTDCYQVLGSTVCGDKAKKIEELKNSLNIDDEDSQPAATERKQDDPTPKPDLTKSTTMQNCLKSAGFSYKVDASSIMPSIAVTNADGAHVADLDLADSAATAKTAANVDNEMAKDAQSSAESEGWDVDDQPAGDDTEAIDRYMAWWWDATEAERQTIRDCISA